MQEIGLGPANLGRIDEGEDLALANAVTGLFLHAPDRPGRPRGQARVTRRLIVCRAVGSNVLGDGPYLDRCDLDAGLVNRIGRREFDPHRSDWLRSGVTAMRGSRIRDGPHACLGSFFCLLLVGKTPGMRDLPIVGRTPKTQAA